MSARTVTSPRAQAQLLLARCGAAWPLALVLAIAAGALYQGALQPTRVALTDARERLVQAVQSGRAIVPPAPARTEAQQLRELRAILPPSAGATLQIARLDALARAQQIAVAQAEYVRRTQPAMQLVQLQVTQPIKAGYPQVKRYVQEVLRTMPNVSLDQVAARRDNVGQSQLEVRLRWSVWMQAPAGAEAGP